VYTVYVATTTAPIDAPSVSILRVHKLLSSATAHNEAIDITMDSVYLQLMHWITVNMVHIII